MLTPLTSWIFVITHEPLVSPDTTPPPPQAPCTVRIIIEQVVWTMGLGVARELLAKFE